jgi:hypothetical protein
MMNFKLRKCVFTYRKQRGRLEPGNLNLDLPVSAE